MKNFKLLFHDNTSFIINASTVLIIIYFFSIYSLLSHQFFKTSSELLGKQHFHNTQLENTIILKQQNTLFLLSHNRKDKESCYT